MKALRLLRLSSFTLALSVTAACGAPPRGTIGAVLIQRSDGRVFVRDVPPHLAAAKAGVLPGDELLLIEGQDVRRLGEDDLRRVLSGHVDEPVRLTFVRGAEVHRVTIHRSMAEPYRVE
jgi:C-terminal processing protease CtpA/Prc